MMAVIIDAFNTGLAKAERRDSGFFSTYNRTDAAERVQDILTAAVYLSSRSDVRRVHLVGLDRFGLHAMLAHALAIGISQSCAADVGQFDNHGDSDFTEHLSAPSLRSAGDVRTAMALAAPRRLIIFNTGEKFDVQWAVDSFRAARAARKLNVQKGPVTGSRIVGLLQTEPRN
jgi:hypothetical protein